MASATVNRPPQTYNRVPRIAFEDMDGKRGTAVLVGALFLLFTATFIFSNVLITPLLAPTTSWLLSPNTRSS
jgi:hypothetical protein